MILRAICLMWLLFSLVVAFAQTEPRLVLPIGHTDDINSAAFSSDGKLAITCASSLFDLDNTSRIFEVSSGKELQALTGHSDGVLTAVLSPDGKLALTASSDKTSRIWEVATGKELYCLNGHEGVVRSALFSSDGKFALTSSTDGTSRIYEVATGQELHALRGHTGWVVCASFSSDGKQVLTASDDGTARLWDAQTGVERFILRGHTGELNSAVFSADGSLVITASHDGTARIWDARTGLQLKSLQGHSGVVNYAIFSPDGKMVLTSSADSTARVWDTDRGIELLKLQGHTETVRSAIFSPTGNYILTGSEKEGHLWEADSGRELLCVLGHRFAVFSPDGKRVLMSIGRNSAGIWDVENSADFQVIQGYSELVMSLSIHPDGNQVLTASGDFQQGKTRVFNMTTGAEVISTKGHNSFYKYAHFSLDGSHILTNEIKFSDGSDEESNLCVYDAASGDELQTLKLQGVAGLNNNTIFCSDGKWVVNASSDGTARIYEVATGKELHTLSGHTESINSTVFSPDGTRVLTASDDATARIWDAQTGRQLKILEGHSRPINSAVYSRDGKLVLTASEDSTARMYDVTSGNELHVFSGHKDEIRSAVFSPDGKLILTASYDSTARVYEVSSGKQLQVLSSPMEYMKSVVFSPDGKLVLTAGSNNTARLYEVSTGKELRVLSGHTSWLNSAVFSGQGKYIITTGADHKTMLWETATGKMLYTRLQLKGNDWLVYDEHYRFDGTPGAIEKLYFVCGVEPIELAQMKDALYVPGLAEKIINGEDINYKKLSDLDICGALPIVEKIHEMGDGWKFSIEQRRWPIVRLEVMVDGKIVKTIAPGELKFADTKANLHLARADLQQHLKTGEENKVTVVAITEYDKREFKSRGVQLQLAAQGEKQDPNLYMLMIGVNDYKDDALDLRFPVQDAMAFGSALESSARKLLGDDKVFVYNVQSRTDHAKLFTTPERAGVMKALEEIGKKAKTNDVLFIFFAGHGVMQGVDNTFTFLTADASRLVPVGISTNDLKSWLSPEGPFHMMPNKTVLVYDACNSGQASRELADLAMARDDNSAERQRQIEDLGDKSGVFILSASAPNQSAYELPHLGQGMLTYSLLATLKNNPAVLDEDKNGKGFLNLQKWFLETEREQSRLMQSLGLKQEAQPYGTANIRIGLVDDEVRNGITLLVDKPLVYCSNARDDNDYDPLDLKEAVNSYLETATSRGTSSKLGFIKAETSKAHIVKLVYSISGDTVRCRILIFKNKVKINELSVITTTTAVTEDIVKALEGSIQ